MPYTVKATTTWADETLPLDERVAKVKALYSNNFQTETYNPNSVRQIRQNATKNGDLLARGVILSPDGLTITVTNVWKSQKAYEAFATDPLMVEYRQLMKDAGWNTEIVFV